MIEPTNTLDVPLSPHAVSTVTVEFAPTSSEEDGVA
jgi:hypothetical protein